MAEIEISIVVANWNGGEILSDCLASLWASACAAEKAFEIIVVDDASSDDSRVRVASEFPQIRLLENPENIGFARTSNRGAQEASGRVLIMMNNDMRVARDFVEKLTAPFFDPRNVDASPLFAVGGKTVEWEGGAPNHLCMRGGVASGGNWGRVVRPFGAVRDHLCPGGGDGL